MVAVDFLLGRPAQHGLLIFDLSFERSQYHGQHITGRIGLKTIGTRIGIRSGNQGRVKGNRAGDGSRNSSQIGCAIPITGGIEIIGMGIRNVGGIAGKGIEMCLVVVLRLDH